MKHILTFLALASASVAMAEEFPYLAFESADGSIQTVDATGVDASFIDGVLVVNHSDGVLQIPVSELSKFYFTSEKSSLADVSIASSPVKAYSVTGIFAGDFANVADAQKQLPAGIYIVKSEYETFKICVK